MSERRLHPAWTAHTCRPQSAEHRVWTCTTCGETVMDSAMTSCPGPKS